MSVRVGDALRAGVMSVGVGNALDQALGEGQDHAEAAAAHAGDAEASAAAATVAAVVAAGTLPDDTGDLATHLAHRERIVKLEGETEWLKEQLAASQMTLAQLQVQLTPPIIPEAETEAETEAEAAAETEAETETGLDNLAGLDGRKESLAVPVEMPEAVAAIVEAPAAVVTKARRGFKLI